jgi:Flp pilus assembly protein TadD
MEEIEDLWMKSGSDTADLLLSRAAQFLREDDVGLSLKILDALVEIAPDNAEAWHQRAKAHLMQRDYAHALGDLRRTLSLDPNNYRAIVDLGIVLEELGHKKEALEAYGKALQVNPFLDDTRQAVEALKREVEGQDI